MSFEEVQRDRWPTFAQGFSMQHANWLATLEVEHPRREDESVAVTELLVAETRLYGIAFLQTPEGEAFWVSMGEHREEVVKRIQSPVRVVLMKQDGAHAGLQIDARNGDTYRLHFRTAARPEELNGIG